MAGTPNALPSTTLAVFRPTPGRVVRSSTVRGTSPPWRSTSALAIPDRARALARKNPVEWISRSSVARSALAQSCARWYRRNRSAVTTFTRSSVHCAERIVATRSSSGVLKRRARAASGYARSSRTRIFVARARRAGTGSTAMGAAFDPRPRVASPLREESGEADHGLLDPGQRVGVRKAQVSLRVPPEVHARNHRHMGVLEEFERERQRVRGEAPCVGEDVERAGR